MPQNKSTTNDLILLQHDVESHSSFNSSHHTALQIVCGNWHENTENGVIEVIGYNRKHTTKKITAVDSKLLYLSLWYFKLIHSPITCM